MRVAAEGLFRGEEEEMTANESTITANAAELQMLDEFNPAGWVKVVAPAKVNLHLGIGGKRPDGYHDAVSVLHALNLHDVLYVRREDSAPGTGLDVQVQMLGRGEIEVPDVPVESNIATKAVRALAQAVGRAEDEVVRLRIEKNIPAQAGLGGGSSDAAAALVGVSRLWGLTDGAEVVERVARTLGSDVAFFLRGGCAYYEGTGEVFVHELAPMKKSVVLVKPDWGVSTAAAYAAFDDQPVEVGTDVAAAIATAKAAEDVVLFNNLASASERIEPQLAEIREWLVDQRGVQGVLLCGSGSTTFGVCEDFATACQVVADARRRGLWARATAFGPLRAVVVGA